ncbi:MAG: GspE/PulE family protein [Clostridiaceae bacterium]
MENEIRKTINDLLQKGFSNEFIENNSFEDAPCVKIVNSILEYAIQKRASDIHIEPFKNDTLIRFRINGDLEEICDLPSKYHSIVVGRIKVMSGINIAEKRFPQDGKAEFYKDEFYDLRIATLPTIYGEKIVIRLLQRDSKLINLMNLGFEDENIIESIVNKRCGIILVTGPTGSGKSTTLHAILNEIKKNKLNIITLEDPVEYTTSKINQVSVKENLGLTFSTLLRSILRQDPDVIMIGEIRDSETAKIAVRAAETGHLVFSTLHTKNAIGAINRLYEMGVENYLIADSLVSIISQRLIKKLCPFCKEEYKASDKEKKILNIENDDLILYKGIGCNKCNNTGYIGRTVVYEYLNIDNDIKNMLQNEEKLYKIKKYIHEKGFISMNKRCYLLLLEGKINIEDFLEIGAYDD